MTTKKKLSAPQQQVIDRLAAGETLNVDSPTRGGLDIWWRGDPSQRVSVNTFYALRERGLVTLEPTERYWRKVGKLSDAGRALATQPEVQP